MRSMPVPASSRSARRNVSLASSCLRRSLGLPQGRARHASCLSACGGASAQPLPNTGGHGSGERFFAALRQVQSWGIDPTRRKLVLLDANDRPLMLHFPWPRRVEVVIPPGISRSSGSPSLLDDPTRRLAPEDLDRFTLLNDAHDLWPEFIERAWDGLPPRWRSESGSTRLARHRRGDRGSGACGGERLCLCEVSSGTPRLRPQTAERSFCARIE
jgi:hypothetical protein